MTEASVFPEPVIIPLDDLREKLSLVSVDVLRQMLETQGLRLLPRSEVPPQGSIVIPPGRGKATREGLHKALDCIVAAWIATWPSGELRSLQTTSIMELMMWAGEWWKETGAE